MVLYCSNVRRVVDVRGARDVESVGFVGTPARELVGELDASPSHRAAVPRSPRVRPRGTAPGSERAVAQRRQEFDAREVLRREARFGASRAHVGHRRRPPVHRGARHRDSDDLSAALELRAIDAHGNVRHSRRPLNAAPVRRVRGAVGVHYLHNRRLAPSARARVQRRARRRVDRGALARGTSLVKVTKVCLRFVSE